MFDGIDAQVVNKAGIIGGFAEDIEELGQIFLLNFRQYLVEEEVDVGNQTPVLKRGTFLTINFPILSFSSRPGTGDQRGGYQGLVKTLLE